MNTLNCLPDLRDLLEKHLGNEELPARYRNLLNEINELQQQQQKKHETLENSMEMNLDKMIDLTMQFRNESVLLKAARNEINTLFDNIEDVYFSVDIKNLRIIEISAACEKVYGYPPEEFKNNLNLWKETIYPEDLPLLKNHDADLASGKKVFYQCRIINKDASIHWIDAKVIPTLDDLGNLIRIDGVAADITSKKKAELKAAMAMQLVSESQKLGKMGNWNMNFLNQRAYWSDGLREIYGVGKKYVPSHDSLIKLVHPDDKERVKEELDSITQAGNGEMQFKIVRSDNGLVRDIHSIISIEKDKSGKLLRRFGIAQDVTELKKSQAELEKLNLQMYQVSHDLRGPLNSAKNYIYLAQKKVTDEVALNYLLKIHDSYSKMEHRVLSLLDIQRLNRKKLNLENIELSTLIKEIISSIDGVQGFKEVKIETALSNLPPVFKSDRQFLHSILHNLISNAIVYRRKDAESLIKINANQVNDCIVIQVADNGPGIPDNMKERVFEKFVKGGASLNGTGLGLYIVKSLVEKLKGTIEFRSTTGIGTTFTIALPLNSSLSS